MKKLTTISLFIFGVITTAILTAGLVFYQNNNLPAPNSSGLNNQAGASTGGANANRAVILNSAEINKHNSAGDCWLIINNKVYDLTSYLGDMHPGGAGTIIPYCGKEATGAFNTKGGRGAPHSNFADSQLANYLVGDLNQTITQEKIQPNTQKINSQALPPAGRGDNGYDD